MLAVPPNLTGLHKQSHLLGSAVTDGKPVNLWRMARPFSDRKRLTVEMNIINAIDQHISQLMARRQKPISTPAPTTLRNMEDLIEFSAIEVWLVHTAHLDWAKRSCGFLFPTIMENVIVFATEYYWNLHNGKSASGIIAE
ncbi:MULTISPECIES: hypothetical protein [Paenibacillus]|uniref:hypothetical protein n=1 Tax=Paenibacillus TaxID=44249 RepID=UPI00117D3A87|nr:hypothetical protein [Paenibacillus lautus]